MGPRRRDGAAGAETGGAQAPGGGDGGRRPGRGWSGDPRAQPGRTAPLHSAWPRHQGDRRAHGRSSAPAPALVSAPAPPLAPSESRKSTGTVSRKGTRSRPHRHWHSDRRPHRHGQQNSGSHAAARNGHRHTDTGTQGPAPVFSTQGGTPTPHGTGHWHRQRAVMVHGRSSTPCSGTRAHTPVHQHLHRWMHTCTLTPHPRYLEDGTPMSPSGPCHSTRTQGCTAMVRALVVSEGKAVAVHSLAPCLGSSQPRVTSCLGQGVTAGHPLGARGAAAQRVKVPSGVPGGTG